MDGFESQPGARNAGRRRHYGSLSILRGVAPHRLTLQNKSRTLFCICSGNREAEMLKVFVEEAAALASIVLFLGMIAIWAQVIPQL